MTTITVRDRKGGNLTLANAQWASRPDDQRFLSIEELRNAVKVRAPRRLGGEEVARERVFPIAKLQTGYTPEGELFVAGHNGAQANFTNWSFTQYVHSVGGPDVRWCREMPAPIVSDTLAASVKFRGRVEADDEAKLFYVPPAMSDGAMTKPGELRALTSPGYGRIFDLEVVDAVIRMNRDGRWVVPGKVSGGGLADDYTSVTKLSTTLYASDRDTWMFLVDETHPIDVNGQTLFRGFVAYNSEVGSQTFGLITFVYNRVCRNRIIRGATEVKELKVRHTSGGPARFADQAVPALRAYSEGSGRNLIEAVQAAQARRITTDTAFMSAADRVKTAEAWLQKRGFGQMEAKVSVQLAAEGGENGGTGDVLNLWDVVQGATAYARTIPHTDSRIDFERKAGALLDTVKP